MALRTKGRVRKSLSFIGIKCLSTFSKTNKMCKPPTHMFINDLYFEVTE